MIAEGIMVGLMIYQVTMPAVNNGKYQLVFDGESIVRMNTQDGTMERCNKLLKCVKIKKDIDNDKTKN